MENSTAQKSVEHSLLKVDDLDMLDVAYETHHFHLFVHYEFLPLEKKYNLFFKRIFDFVFSSVLILCVFSWLLPVIALLIKIDSKGPVFFLQKRNKKNNDLFTCIKFRTMIVNEQADNLAAVEDDYRITRAGKFLRKNHLDEMPQLLNVCCGDMSLIGPRPYMIVDNQRYEDLIEHYSFRHRIKPGITGPAQLLGYTGNVSDIQKMANRVEMDFFYVKNWSLKLDIQILLHTFFKAIGFNSIK